jgi:biotin operon repressor
MRVGKFIKASPDRDDVRYKKPLQEQSGPKIAGKLSSSRTAAMTYNNPHRL